MIKFNEQTGEIKVTNSTSSKTEISDEEIEKFLKSLPFTKHLDDGQYNDGVIDGAELGIKWYREQIKKNSMNQDIIEEAEKEFIKLLNGKALSTKQLTEVAEHYFIVGYEVATEKRYSEEQLKLAYMQAYNRGVLGTGHDMESYIEFIKQK